MSWPTTPPVLAAQALVAGLLAAGAHLVARAIDHVGDTATVIVELTDP